MEKADAVKGQVGKLNHDIDASAGSGQRQSGGSAAAEGMLVIDVGIGELRAEHGIGVFVELLGCLEVNLVTPIVLELAFVGRVLATDLRAGFVDAAAVIRLAGVCRWCAPAGTRSRPRQTRWPDRAADTSGCSQIPCG